VRATAATGLSYSKDKLLLHGQPVPTVSPMAAHLDFTGFLESLGKKVILIAHNGWKFDAPALSRELKELRLWGRFRSVVIGFVDTLPLFRNKLARQKPPSYKQVALAEWYHIPVVEAHNAVNDCQVLSEILKAAEVGDAELKSFFKPLDFTTMEEAYRARKARVVKTYSNFTEYVKSTTLSKLGAANITLEDLRQTFAEGGGEGVKSFLQQDVHGKPRITKTKAVINRIIEGLSIL